MKRLKKVLLGFLKYFGTFLASIVCVAGIMVVNHLLTQEDNSGNKSNPQGNNGEASSIEKIFNNLEAIEKGKFDINIKVNLENQNIELGSSLIIERTTIADNGEEVTATKTDAEESDSADVKTKIKFAGNVVLGETEVPFLITYLNSELFIEIDEQNFKIETTDILGTLDSIMKLDLFSSLDFKLSFSSLNWKTIKGMVVGFGRSAKSTEIDGGLNTALDVMGYGVINFITDADFNLKEISIDKIALEGVEVTGGVSASLNNETIENIEKPLNADKATDLTQFDKVLKGVDSLTKSGKVSGQLNIDINNFNKAINYEVNFKDKKNVSAYFDCDIAGEKAYVIYENNMLYVAYGNYKLCTKCGNFDFNGLIDNAKDIFGKLTQEVGEKVDLSKIEIQGYKLADFNIESLYAFLAQNFNGIVFAENEFSISVEKAQLKVLINNDCFEKVLFIYDGNEYVSLSLNDEIEKTEFDFSQFDNIYENVVEKFEKLVNKGIVSGTISITADSINQDINYEIDFRDKDNISAYAETNILGQNAYFVYKNRKIYVAYDAYKYFIDIKTFDLQSYIAVVKETLSAFDVDLDVKTQELRDALTVFGYKLDELTIQNILQIIKDNFGGVVLGKEKLLLSFEKAKLSITSKNGVFDGVEFDYDNEKYVEMSLNDDIDKAQLDFDKFEDFAVVKEKIDILAKQIKSKKLAVNVEFEYQEYNVLGKVVFDNGELSANFDAIVMNRPLNIKVVNNTIFVNFDGLKLLCNINDIPNLVSYVCELLGINESDLGANLDGLKNIDISEITSQLEVVFKDEILTVNYKNILAKIDLIGLQLNQIFVDVNGGNAKIELCEVEKIIAPSENYIDLYKLKALTSAVYNTLSNLSMSGTINVTLDLFGEKNPVAVDYSVAYRDEKIIGYIETEFKGLKINVYFDGEQFYFSVVGLKFKLGFNDVDDIIDWLNDTFGLDISREQIKEKIDEIIEKLKNSKLDFVENLETSDGFARVLFKNGIQIDLTFDNYIRSVFFSQGTREATLTCTDFSTVTLDNLKKDEFRNYQEFTAVIANFYNFIKTKQYDVVANVNIFSGDTLKSNYGADIQIDATGALQAYANISGLGDGISLIYQDKTAYVCYGGQKGLKVCVEERAIQEILGIVLSAMNFDTSSIPFLDDFLIKEDIDTSNISTILPTIELGNPLQYLEYIQEFDVKDGQFSIILRGEKFSNQNENEDVRVVINYADDKITSIKLDNLFISNEERISGLIEFNDFAGVTKVTDKSKYINLSNSSDLIKAFVNTSQLNDYHVTGSVLMSIKLGDLEMNAAQIGVDVAVRLDENHKPIIAMEFTSYPLIGLVNNKNTNGVGATGKLLINQRHRTISIYYQNGEIILKTFDEHWGAYKELTRVTKVTPEYLFDNLNYYMQWVLGFTDSIQSKIEEAINTANQNKQNATEKDYEDIILNYTKNGDTHSCDVNIGKLAYNDDVGTLHVDISTIKNVTTGNKEYIGQLGFTLDLLDSMIILKTDSSNKLNLVDIGQSADISQAVLALNDTKFVLDGEYELTENGSWKKANQGSRTVTLYSDGAIYATMSGEIGTTLSLPNLSNKIVDNGITYKEYKFEGWYVDEDFTTIYSSPAYPRYDTTLYAKWTQIIDKKYVEINFITNQDEITQTNLIGLNGDTLILPVYSNLEETIDSNTSKLKIFEGWYLDADFKTKFESSNYPETNITLYAKWREEVTKTYELKIIYDGSVVYNGKVPGDVEFIFPTQEYFKANTKYFDEDGKEVTNFVVTQNTTWVARNYFNYKITSSQGYKVGETIMEGFSEEFTKLNGDSLTLPKLMKNSVSGIAYDTEYVFKGYRIVGTDTIVSADETFILPAKNITLEAVWEEVKWCEVVFDVNAWAYPSWWTSSLLKKDPTNFSTVSNTNETNKVRVKYGTILVFSNYTATCKCKYGPTYSFITKGWADKVSNIYDDDYDIESITISSHQTLKPVWAHK